MIISSDAVDGHLPSPPSNPSSSLPSMAIPSSDEILDGHLLSDSANLQVQGDLGFKSELSNSHTTSSAKVVSTDPDGNCSDPIANLEDQLMEEVLPLHGQSLDGTPIDTRDYDSVVSSDGWESLQDELLANLSVDPAETPIVSEGDKDERKSAMEIEPKRKPLRSFRNWPGWFDNSSCGLESEFGVSDSWDSSRERWGYGQDYRPSSFSLPAETGVVSISDFALIPI